MVYKAVKERFLPKLTYNPVYPPGTKDLASIYMLKVLKGVAPFPLRTRPCFSALIGTNMEMLRECVYLK